MKNFLYPHLNPLPEGEEIALPFKNTFETEEARELVLIFWSIISKTN